MANQQPPQQHPHQQKDVVSRYFVIKVHPWRGNLKRILVIGKQHIATHEVSEYKSTNSYNCNDIREFYPIDADDHMTVTTGGDQLLGVHFPGAKMKFKTQHRADVLTDLLRVCQHYPKKYDDNVRKYANMQKFKWSGVTAKCSLEVGVFAVRKLDPNTQQILSTYLYKDIYRLCILNDSELGSAFVISTTSNEQLHLFVAPDDATRNDIMERIRMVARKNVGTVVPISNEALTLPKFLNFRLGVDVSSITPLHSFVVYKVSIDNKNSAPLKRFLCLTDQYLLERDANTNEIINLRLLVEIYAIVRPKNDSQLFSVQFVNGKALYFTSTERDNLLASLLDSVRTSGNVNVHVKFDLNHHQIVFNPEIEAVRYLNQRVRDPNFASSLDIFIECSYTNTNLNNEFNRKDRKEFEKYTHLAVLELLSEDSNDVNDDEFNKQLLALRYLFSTKPGFTFFTGDRTFKVREIELLFIKVKRALSKDNDVIIFTAIDMLSTLMQPMYDENDLLFEQRNKQFLLSSERFPPILLNHLNSHIVKGTGSLIISSILEYLIYALCAPYSETTDGGHFDMLLNLVAKSGRNLFKLFNHHSFSIVKATCLLIKAIIEEGTPQIAKKMQEIALAEGTFLFHLNSSLFPINSGDKFMPIQILSRKLLTLWTVDNDVALNLMNCIFPLGLLNFLDFTEKPPKDMMNPNSGRDNLKMAQENANKQVSALQKFRDQHPQLNVQVLQLERQIENTFNHWRKKIGMSMDVPEEKQTVVLRRRRELIKSTLNWNMFFYQFIENHSKPDLIWNHKTRDELKEALEKEIWHFNSDKELYSSEMISWNFYEFEVNYPSLSDEIKIGSYYLRLLLSQGNNSLRTASGENMIDKLFVKNPNDFFNTLYHRFLSNTKLSMKCDCLQAMSIIYGEYSEEIGPFHDVNFILKLLDECNNRLLRDRIVQFIDKLMNHRTNIKKFIDFGGIPLLIDLSTLSHLHTNRAVIPTQSNVIEASPEMMKGSQEKEWHISNKIDDKPGEETFSFEDLKEMFEKETITSETKCWAQGYHTWCKLINIAQLKWTLVAEGITIFQESDLTILILNILIKICETYPSRASDDSIIRPMPKVKQILTHDNCLQHLVNLLLTFDPVIVERVATLLNLIMQDNSRISQLYQSGVFYFILMYTGSNILPVSRLLQNTHTKQAFKCDENSGNLLQRSILGSMLPEAMVCYLENYGCEEFSKVYLGEFDNPEVIWNSDMRRYMIERIASHIVDFSPRLKSNVRAIYQYCPIPPIQHAQLENELFCNIYYLKNLCDTKRFNEWPIKEPVILLRDILEAWKVEISKEPDTMVVEDALEILGIKDYTGDVTGPTFESLIRKKYYLQAQKYHPDKNPNGREMFEKVNDAYYFLCSNDRKSNGPDAQNIILILKSQSILFSRYNVELYQYKYAGYPMLLKTLKLEMDDQFLFSKANPLLAHACKTVYHSVNCSALNAEELRREEGLDILYDILNRCVSVLSASSKPKELPVKVCKYIISCFGVSAEFAECRKYFYQMVLLSKNVFYLLNYKHLTKMCMSAIDCIIFFCRDPYLQLLLFKAGILFSLLQFIFQYDYTLEESSLNNESEDDQKSKQYLSNMLAKKALSACVMLFVNRFDQAEVEDKSLLDDYSTIRQALYALLTPYIVGQLNMENVPDLLKMLNSNVENPYFIWNNGSRAELIAYLQEQERELLRSGVCIDESFGSKFQFSSHKEELIIGDIFVRIYNRQPSFVLKDVQKFVSTLLDHLGSHAQYLHSIKAVSFPNDDNVKIDENRVVVMKECFMALINLIKNNSGIEEYFVGSFRIIFSFLRLNQCREIQSLVLELIMCLATNKGCLHDISSCQVLINLVLMLNFDNEKINEAQSKTYVQVLEILMCFASNSELIKESLAKGVLLYVLRLFTFKHHFTIREKCSQLFTKLENDKLNGQYTKWVLSHFLPNLFMNAMKESAQNAIMLYDENQENPELIWNEVARTQLQEHLYKLLGKLFADQCQNPNSMWKFTPDCELKNMIDNQEYKIAGVYLRLYVASPGWILSRPKDFLFELLETIKNFGDKESSDEEKMELISGSISALFTTQMNLLSLIPATGFIQVFVNKLKPSKLLMAKACLTILHKFSLDSACVGDMIATNVLATNIAYILDAYPQYSELCCEILIKLFESNSDDFITQSIHAEIINRLLKILDSNASQSSKAKIVQMLQCIQNNPLFGTQITEILAKSSVWNQYKDQKHDLFITNSNTAGLLTGPSVNIAGYLTASRSATSSNPLLPPPREE